MTCPICKSDSDPKYRPFCSSRCADRDLASWMNGSYAVPSRDPEDIEAALDAVEEEVEKALREGRFS
ncbi:DNA gyrase inhibitor YacG [Pseudooceanicola sp. HF7]|uniref:DNA gyrase inhibitor YacG n=1 Tax=Pseudooceanicola sp. HF7 TaxID=2721560 RepID=UPI0014317406|nr:DNA gyrase inhibitor YacG [Pseudooceanicola sp. HF7]NIZ07932.1 DNA gyrase inhibitor YacG [Pseudooceanicola sp. HF7]